MAKIFTKSRIIPKTIFHQITVQIPQKIIDRRDWIKYLVLVDWHMEHLKDIVNTRIDERFGTFIGEQITSYIKGNKIPAEIEAPIMNLADDYLAGKDIVIRAGDYVALHNFYKK